MKYTPKTLKDNVNVTPGSPLRELIKLLAWVVGGLVALYIILGLVVSMMASHISLKVETGMGRLFNNHICVNEIKKESKRLQKLVDAFYPFLTSDDRRLNYKVFVTQNSQVNAMALPGGTIVVFSGLLNKVSSQSELTFILAHELGHFHNRDHLKGLGRALVALVLSVTILGENSSATNFIFNSIGQVEMKFSRNQEKAADLYAVGLLKKRYGNAKGALEFMKKLVREEKRWKLFYYFSSHPHPAHRLKYIKNAL